MGDPMNELTEMIAEAIKPWFQYYVLAARDPQPTHQERVAGVVADALRVIDEGYYLVPRIAYDANPSVCPYIGPGGHLIRREQGDSDPAHTRFYAAQLLAAADVADALQRSREKRDG
jgi:hypothetical protein